MAVNDGINSIVLSSVEMVIRRMEVRRIDNAPACNNHTGHGGALMQCDQVQTAPMVVSLPLNGAVDQQMGLDLAAGSYDRIRFDIHRVTSGDLMGQEFLAQNPAFAGALIVERLSTS